MSSFDSSRLANEDAVVEKRLGKDRAASSRRVKLIDRTISLAILVILLVLTQVLVSTGVISRLLVATPTDVFSALVHGFTSGILPRALWSTLSAAIAGFGLSIVFALILGMLLVLSERLNRILFPYILALQALPKVAIAPLVLIWFGFGDQSKIMLVAFVCFFPLLINTIQGLQIRERGWAELMKVSGASKLQEFRYVRFPGSLPYLFAGLRIGSVFALLGAVVAEFVGAQTGLGVRLLTSRGQFDVPGVFAVLIVLMAIGLVLGLIWGPIERRVAPWSVEEKKSD